MSIQSWRDIERIEREIALDLPFGAYDYISQRIAIHYHCRLRILGNYIAEADELSRLLDTLDPATQHEVLTNAVLRAAIDALLQHFLSSPEEAAEQAYPAFLAHCIASGAELPGYLSPLDAEVPQKLVAHPVRLWLSEHEQRPYEAALAATMSHHTGSRQRYEADAQDTGLLGEALELLATLLPDLARSALGHLYFVVVDHYEDDVGSATIAGIPGTIVLARRLLRSPWLLAESILHECMHLKFVELEHTHSMMAPGYREQESPRIHPAWHPPAVTWPVNRALTAAHVYMVLALYSLAASRRALELERRFGAWQRSTLISDPRTALERGRFLTSALAEHDDDLGAAGRLFLEWIRDRVRALDVAHAELFGTRGKAPA